jgi:hypothetical protein
MVGKALAKSAKYRVQSTKYKVQGERRTLKSVMESLKGGSGQKQSKSEMVAAAAAMTDSLFCVTFANRLPVNPLKLVSIPPLRERICGGYGGILSPSGKSRM